MHKQSKTRRSRAGRFKNRNVRLTESVSNSIIELLRDFDGGGDFAVDYLQSEYLSKYNDEKMTPAATRSQRAIDKWLATEKTNLITNFRLEHMDPGYNILPRVTFASFCKFARRIIHSVLGPLSDTVVLGSMSGGASTGYRKTESHPARKFSAKADATEEVLCLSDILNRQAPFLQQYGIFSQLNEVKGAILFTVPKKTDIDRCACKEPEFNMYLQKGVGDHIRRRLRKFGINLNDQSKNRNLAQVGSLTGDLCTLDLSSASDTITIEAVRTLLPDDWFSYLNCIRSPFVKVRGEYHRTEMFSSMGNGFTFELESLLFWALTRTACYFENIPGVVSIYGDDIICPTGAYDAVTWILSEFGFSVNEDKSHNTGLFRESCGGHFLLGDDVTPFYLKRRPTHLTDLVRVCNQFRRWATTGGVRKYEHAATYNLWLNLAMHVPSEFWGGYDLARDTQLVSPHAPNKQLVRLSSEEDLPDSGLYAHWHNSNWKRSSAADNANAEPVKTSNKCRARRVPKGAPYCADLFYEEEIGQKRILP